MTKELVSPQKRAVMKTAAEYIRNLGHSRSSAMREAWAYHRSYDPRAIRAKIKRASSHNPKLANYYNSIKKEETMDKKGTGMGFGVGGAVGALTGYILGNRGKVTPMIYQVISPTGNSWNAIGFPETKMAMLLPGGDPYFLMRDLLGWAPKDTVPPLPEDFTLLGRLLV